MTTALRSSQIITWKKPGGKTTGTGWIYYSWIASAGDPAAGTLPGTDTAAGVVPTDADAGFPTIDSFNGEAGYVHRVEFTGGAVAQTGLHRASVYDLLWKAGAYPFNANVVLASQPSYAARVPGGDYSTCEIWIEVTANFTGTGDFTIGYQNEAGVSKTTTLSVAAASLANSICWQVPLAAGDRGVKKIESVQCATATVGGFNVLVMRPISKHITITASPTSGLVYDESTTQISRIYDTSALYVLTAGNATFNTTNPELQLHITRGTFVAGTDVHIDLEMPAQRTPIVDVDITATPAVSTTATGASFTYVATDGGVEYRVDGGAWTAPSSNPIVLAGLAVGAHTFDIRSTITNTVIDSFAWTIVAATADITLTGTPAVSTTATSATFTFTASSGAAQYSLDGGAWTDSASPIALVGLALGAHTIDIRSKVDNTAHQSFAWSVVASGGGGGGDTTPPTIAIVSPTPGVAPGAPGGFPADLATARDTPIVLDVTDVTPGNRYICVVARFRGAVGEEVVYRRGSFRGLYAGYSSSTAISNGTRLSVRRQGGWPGSNSLDDVTFEIDAVDAAGNLAS
jgi:hypothetical protein